MSVAVLRKKWLTKPIFNWAKTALPGLSETEREALEAGGVWWDADLFTGNPDWSKLLATPAPRLSEEEQAFLAGPVEDLCRMLNDWQINWELKDLPPEVWDFLKQKKFFAMIIPKKYGGLEFSAYGHSEVIRKIASRSVVAAVTVMVPNSLGPGELLMQFGTAEQQDYWLPRLAEGKEIPCFGLTSAEAGSDAASMIDHGEICRGIYNGAEVLGIRLNWRKRYITLGPVATVLGLAFKLYDPDHLLSDNVERGITVALVPTHLAGIEMGRRHIPAYQMFQNGPSSGANVFIPLDQIIGGEAQIGKGWKMLMTALAAGRGISLPSLSAAGTAFSAHTAGAYARIRQQFKLPIGKFEGVQEYLGRLAATAYLVDAARRMTCAALDAGYKPAVASAIVKVHATSLMRESINDAMDIHGGKAIMDGPSNILGGLYRAIPIGITVEGADILMRNLVIFGQGAIRCHPWLLKEMTALEEDNLDDFDSAFWGHLGHSFKTLGRAWGRNWTGGWLSPAPAAASSKVKNYYRQLGHSAAAFALLSEIALLTIGKDLKRREMISARLGDILSQLYLLSSVLKRWEDDGQQQEDLPLVAYCMENGFSMIENRTAAVLRNLPNRPAAWVLRLIVQPFGPWRRGPSDVLIKTCAAILLSPSATRNRLTAGLYSGTGNDPVAILEKTFRLVHETKPENLKDIEGEISRVLSVDDFSFGLNNSIYIK